MESMTSSRPSIAKIVDLPSLAAARDELATAGKRLVLTNGCFDLLHVGHVRYLVAARRGGDALAVALNSDASVRVLKGQNRPLNSQADRAEILAALACVDFVTIFDEERATGVIERVRPMVYAKGGDYRLETLNPEERAALEDCGAEIFFVPTVPGRSTTKLVDAIRGG
jgi:rfaE bifunctional protein nucleotidyltransferase chain/domain